MKKSTIALVALLLLLTFGVLFVLWRIVFSEPSASQPPTGQPQVAGTLSEQDLLTIDSTARSFVEGLGTYSNYTVGENINIASAYASTTLQALLTDFAETSLADIEPGSGEQPVIGATTTVDEIIVSPPGPDQIQVSVTVIGETAMFSETATTSAGIRGTVFVVRSGDTWLVDDLRFDPPLAGFK